MASFLGGADRVVAAVYLELKEDLKGSIVMIFPKNDAITLIDLINGKNKSADKEWNEFEISALKEIGNITAGTYLGALAKLLNYKISCSVPYLAVEMLGSYFKSNSGACRRRRRIMRF